MTYISHFNKILSILPNKTFESQSRDDSWDSFPK